MLGGNPIRKQHLRNDGHLQVQEIFKTLQGEGPHAGRGAIFLRLAGCNLRCFFCDTDFESNWTNVVSPQDLAAQIARIVGESRIHLLVITGGEPLLQNLAPFLLLLWEVNPGLDVQIETAGTIWVPALDDPFLFDNLSLVVSPKTPKVHDTIAAHAMAWKYIVRAGELSPQDGLPAFSTQAYRKEQILARPPASLVKNHPDRIYLQPCDEQNPERNKANINAAIEACMMFGYRLCLQQHKMVGLP